MQSLGMVGQKLGHYRILEKIGAGGMGEVYRAHDEQLDRDVAIKVLPASRFADPSARARLLREARSAAGLNHPHICTIHEVGEAGGQTYIAMEYVEGQPLSARLAGGALSAQQILRYALQLADALGHAHERGIVHRDLKSANVLLTPEGRAKVLDFGLAKPLLENELQEATQSQASLTTAGAVVGTLPCLAPEVLRGEPADARSDIWAFGVMLYEMATAERPFKGRTGFELSSAILREPPPPFPSQVPAGVQAVILRCLEKEPGQRYQRASEVRAALEAVQSDTAHVAAVAPAAAAAQRRAPARRWLVAGSVTAPLLLALAIGLNVGGLRERLLGGAGAPRIESLAVLPLENLSHDPEQEYFADGMTEALITELSKIGALKVISRTSVMRYKGARKPLPQIAKELGVDAVVEGSVLREGDQVRITVQLLHGPSDKHLWAENYQREMRGILALQSEVARAIASEIRLKLTPPEQARLASARPVDPEAHEAYLRGRYAWNKFTVEGFHQARDYFEQATRKDPGYALAYTGLAGAYVQLSGRVLPPREAMPKAKQAALKALELNPKLGEAHYSLAFVIHYYDWNWAEAEKEYRHSMELNPGFALVHTVYAHYLSAQGQFDQALTEVRRARELDPLGTVGCAEARVLYYARRYDQALEIHRKMTELDATRGGTCFWLVPAYEQKGMTVQAISLAQASVNNLPGEDLPIALLAHAYALAGRKREAADLLHKLLALSKERYVSPYDMAVLYTGLGDKDRAIDWLEKAVQARAGLLVYLNVEPLFDPLRSHPRFKDLLRRMNFPQ